MKKLIVLLTAVAFVACNQQKPIDYAIVSGKILNANSDKITLYNEYDFDEKKEILITEEGTFLDTITLAQNQKYLLSENNNGINLFLSKGDDTSITYDAKKLDSTIVISGVGSDINKYLHEKAVLTGMIYEACKKEEADYKKHLVEQKSQKMALLDAQTSFSEDLIQKEKNNIQYEYLLGISVYQTYHRYFTGNKDFKPSEGFDDELSSLTFDKEEDFLFSTSYRMLIQDQFAKKSSEKNDTITPYGIQMLKTFSSIENHLIKNKLLFDTANLQISFTEDLETFYKTYSEASTSEENDARIDKVYNALKLLGKGNTSPEFVDYENYAGGTVSLSDLKGKYVYIDVWATWCGPCKAEIPSLKKVEKQFHGKNIEFVSISIDNKEDHEAWKKMIVDKELGGTQLFADNDWQSKFIQDYMIKGIPRFILIDPSGNIVNSNAPRPSNKKLAELFDELLNKA